MLSKLLTGLFGRERVLGGIDKALATLIAVAPELLTAARTPASDEGFA